MEMTNLKEKDKEKIRKPILKELDKLGKKYGVEKVGYTFNWWNRIQVAKRSREKEIKKLEAELEGIKKGKIPY